jgi:STE24 endopeptidase
MTANPSTPDHLEPLDPQRQQQAKIYARLQRRLMLVDLGLGGLYGLAWLVFGWSAGLKQLLLKLTTAPWLLVFLYAAVFGGIYILINLPLSYYSSFSLPHRFGQSTENRRGWVLDQLKGLLLGAVLGGLMLEAVYALLRSAPQTWWLWAAGLMLVFNVLLANLAPVLLFPIFYKFTPLGEEHRELAERLLRLSERAGTHVQGVYQFDMSRRTPAANAALTGLGNTRRIILGDTLLAKFTPNEIETVLAHELGHHVNRDIPLSIAFETVSTVVGLWLASLALNWGVGALGLESPADIAALPLFMLSMGLFGLVTMPLSNVFSRWRETLADRYALASTRRPQAFAAAMTRLANQNLGELDPEPWVETLLYSHPALGRRIRMAEEFAQRMEIEGQSQP